MLGTRISCRIASYQRFVLTSISNSVLQYSILSNRAASDNSETVHSMDKTAGQQAPQETVEPASEGAPETFEVYQPRDMKSNSEAGKCNPLIDPHCAHDDKLPGDHYLLNLHVALQQLQNNEMPTLVQLIRLRCGCLQHRPPVALHQLACLLAQSRTMSADAIVSQGALHREDASHTACSAMTGSRGYRADDD